MADERRCHRRHTHIGALGRTMAVADSGSGWFCMYGATSLRATRGGDGLPHFSGSPGRCGRARLRSDPPGDGILLPRQADPAWPFPRSGEFIPDCPLPHLKDSPARSSGFMTCQPMDALPCLVSIAVKEPRDPIQRTARDVTIGAQPSDENPQSRCRHP